MTSASAAYRQLLLWVGILELFFWTVFLFVLNPWGEFLGSYSWLHPEYFWFLMILPLLLIASVFHWKYKSELAERYGTSTQTAILTVRFKSMRAFLHYLLLRSVFFFAILSLAQPVKGSKKVDGTKRMLDIVICLDVSNSMNTKDMSGDKSRIEAAKSAISELVNGLNGERISVIIFANSAYTQLPLTADIGAAKLFVPEISTSLITDQGTNIGAAFELALNQFKDDDAGRHVLVITDGEDHEKKWYENLSKLKAKGVGFTYLGLGTTTGGLIPIDPAYPELGYKKHNGSTIVSRLDKSGIEQMARTSNGNVSFSSSAYPDLRQLVSIFKNSTSKTVKKTTFKVAVNYFTIPLWIAIFCFVMYLFLPQIVNRQK